MTDPPPIQQHGAAVTICGAPLLAAAYRATLAGIARRRADGLPAADLQQLAIALRRAHIDAMSPPRHKDAGHATGGPQSNGQDGADLIGVAEAAAILSLSPRQVQRLAARNAVLDGQRIGKAWALRRAPVLVLAAQRKAATE